MQPVDVQHLALCLEAILSILYKKQGALSWHGKEPTIYEKIHPPLALAHLWFLERQLPQSICCFNSMRSVPECQGIQRKAVQTPQGLLRKGIENPVEKGMRSRGSHWSVCQLYKMLSGQITGE